MTEKSKLNLGGKNETDEGSTVRCPSKEPANPHNPNTTHTPITYAGHNTSKHARNPVHNGAHERVEWRHGRTAWRETSFENEGQTGNCLPHRSQRQKIFKARLPGRQPHRNSDDCHQQASLSRLEVSHDEGQNGTLLPPSGTTRQHRVARISGRERRLNHADGHRGHHNGVSNWPQ